MVILALLGCVFDDDNFGDCFLSGEYDCSQLSWRLDDPGARPGAAFEFRAGAGVGDMVVDLIVSAYNPSTEHDCLVAVYEGDAEPSPSHLVALDASAGAPATMGVATLVAQANLAREWGMGDADERWDWDTGTWDTGWDTGAWVFGPDPDEQRFAFNWTFPHRTVHTWITVATCGDVEIRGDTRAQADYRFAVAQDPLYRFRLEQVF